MGTWNIPYNSVEKAKRLKKRMGKPWIAKVRFDGTYYDLNYADMDLIGDDLLAEDLEHKAKTSKKDFDIRPYVKRVLKDWMQELFVIDDISSLEAVNITRSAVGLRPRSTAEEIIKANLALAEKSGIRIKIAGKPPAGRKGLKTKKKILPKKR